MATQASYVCFSFYNALYENDNWMIVT